MEPACRILDLPEQSFWNKTKPSSSTLASTSENISFSGLYGSKKIILEREAMTLSLSLMVLTLAELYILIKQGPNLSFTQ